MAWQLMTGAESNGRLGMSLTEGPRGEPFPAHRHRSTYEAIYVLDGRVRVVVGEDEHLLTRGDFASIPSGVQHTIALEGQLTRYVSMYGPAGPERLAELAGEASEHRIFPEHAEAADAVRLAAAAAEIDIVFEF
jgi:quercetin 2,3-dioxygenase